AVRIILAILSIFMNARLLQLIMRCYSSNEEKLHKLFCLLYSSIPLFFILFSIFELATHQYYGDVQL
ncbi:hypothetical protein PENTCL1PPCAC_27113, partial [Pristionchus entomophagus]